MNTARYLANEPDAFDCCAHACGATLNADELWICNGCGAFFCEAHIADLNETDGAPYSLYVCEACRAQRLKKTPASAPERRYEGAA
jgi:hypothetical protein